MAQERIQAGPLLTQLLSAAPKRNGLQRALPPQVPAVLTPAVYQASLLCSRLLAVLHTDTSVQDLQSWLGYGYLWQWEPLNCCCNGERESFLATTALGGRQAAAPVSMHACLKG